MARIGGRGWPACRMAVFNGNSPNPWFSLLRSAETLELWFLSLRSKFNCAENYCKFESNMSRSQKCFSGVKFYGISNRIFIPKNLLLKILVWRRSKLKFEFPRCKLKKSLRICTWFENSGHSIEELIGPIPVITAHPTSPGDISMTINLPVAAAHGSTAGE